jgi:hypothetical protein
VLGAKIQSDMFATGLVQNVLLNQEKSQTQKKILLQEKSCKIETFTKTIR